MINSNILEQLLKENWAQSEGAKQTKNTKGSIICLTLKPSPSFFVYGI